MAERAIARKSQFLHSILPVVDTYEEVVKKKFKRGKFMFTSAGIVKIVAFLFLLIGLALFIGISKCENTPEWYDYLLPISSGLTLLVSFGLYLSFSAGLIVNNPGLWIKIDISCCLLFSLFTIACGIASINACKSPSSLRKVPEPLCLTGSALLIVSCAAVFLLYRYREDDDNVNYNKETDIQASRKSIFA